MWTYHQPDSAEAKIQISTLETFNFQPHPDWEALCASFLVRSSSTGKYFVQAL